MLSAFRVFCVAVLVNLLLASPSHALPDKLGKDEQGFYASGRLLVMPQAGLPENKFLNILSKRAAILESNITNINVRIVRVPPGLEKKILAELRTDQGVEFAELDRVIPPVAVSNDPYYSSQWHLQKIHADTAWDSASANNLIIAILDTGVDVLHPDLAGVMVPGWNSVSQNNSTGDIYGHGTAVAGTAAAIVNNAIGVAGVARNARIMPIRITNNSSTGSASYSAMASGLTWAANNGAKVANLSYVGTGSATVESAAQYFMSKGGLFFSSAGNNNNNPGYADTPYIVTVASTNTSDTRSYFSSFGSFVDLAAPGESIYSTNSGGGYGGHSGTSFSSPLAAGMAALIFGVNSSFSPSDVEYIMEQTAYKPTGSFTPELGNGRVDAAAAVTMALTYVPPVVDSTKPVTSIGSPSANAIVNGLVTVSVNASDNIGVTKVDLFVNGAFYASDTQAPYSFSWDTVPLGNSNATLTASAYDAAGNKGTATGVPVQVRNINDTTPPAVTITNPANGAKLAGTVTVNANATDNVALISMTLLVDDKVSASSSGGGALSYNLNTKKLKPGSHTLTVEAKDSSGNIGTQSIVVYR